MTDLMQPNQTEKAAVVGRNNAVSLREFKEPTVSSHGLRCLYCALCFFLRSDAIMYRKL